MYIDILVGIFAGLIVLGLLFYFIINRKNKKSCNCSAMKHYKNSLKKARKEIKNEHNNK